MDNTDEVRERLARIGDALPAAHPALPVIARKGRGRRMRNVGTVAASVVAISAAILVPASLMRGLGDDPVQSGGGKASTGVGPTTGAVVLPTNDQGDVVPDAVLGSVFCSEGEGSGAVKSADGRDPVTICEDVWSSMHGSVPPAMTACASGKGGVWVYQHDEIVSCTDEGLAEIPAGYREAARRFAAVVTDLQRQFPGGTCWQAPELMTAVRAALDAHGFDYWNVEDRTHPGTPCASASFIDYAHLSYQVLDEARPGHV